MTRFGFPLIFVAVLCVAMAKPAAASDKWAVLSLVGDSLMLVGERAGTGTNLDPNVRDRAPVDDDSVDRIVLRAVTASLKDANAPEMLALLIRDQRLYALQGRLLTSDEGAPLTQGLVRAAGGAGASYLLVIARNPGEFRIEISDGSVGVGSVDGLGFYVNRRTPLVVRETGHTGKGYFAAFAMLRLMLVDLKAQRMVADKPLKATAIFPVAGAVNDEAWDLLDGPGKVRALERTLTDGMRDIVPDLLAQTRR